MARSLRLSVLVALVGMTTSSFVTSPAFGDGVDAAAFSATAATSEGADVPEISVAELDLAGVDPASLADLPETAPEPAEEVIPPAAPDTSSQPAAPTEPQPSSAPEPTPDSTEEAAAETRSGPAPLIKRTSDVGPSQLAPGESPPDVLTPELSTDPFSVLGVTWDSTAASTDVVIRYRVRQAGVWSEWEAVAPSDVAPDASSPEGAGSTRGATDPIVAVDADGLQVWAEAEPGRVTGLKAVLIDPGDDPVSNVDQASASTKGARVTTAAEVATAAPSQPAIIRRAEWGADESLRTCEPDLSMDTASAAVHHTASTNSYAAADVPGLLRGFLAYHTRPEAAGGRGWCDIGYNFLVDKFGRIYEGRAGSIEMAVVGVHTGGFNSRTIGVSAIGEYGSAAAPAVMLEGISQVIAWKFASHRILANSSVTMISGGGASKYPQGTAVTFPTIYGHRDAQLTSCPGQNLYDALPSIRNRVAQLVNVGVLQSPQWNIEAFTAGMTDISISGWAVDPESSDPVTLNISIDGTVHPVVADRERPDLAPHFPTSGTRHGFGATFSVGGGSHRVCITALNLVNGYDTLLGCAWKTPSNRAPIGALELVETTASTVRVSGWALDPDSEQPIDVHVYVAGTALPITANLPRADIGAAYGKGANHGFDTEFTVPGGTHQLCVYAIDATGGPNPAIACRTVTVTNRMPIGTIEGVTTTTDSITLSGWTLDPDTTNPIGVHIYLDGRFATATTANLPRADVGAAFGKGPNHGYTLTFPATNGTHSVCAYAIDATGGPNPAVACRTVTVR